MTHNQQIIEDAILILQEGKVETNMSDMAAIYAAKTLLDNAIVHHEARKERDDYHDTLLMRFTKTGC